MAYTQEIKHEVQKLRAEGKTYSEILKKIQLHIPKSTLSNWCEAIKLPEWYQAKIDEMNRQNGSKALHIAQASNKIKREKLLNDLRLSSKELLENLYTKDICKLALSILYLGEGAKWKSHAGLMLGSSDPDIIRLYIYLLSISYDIPPKELKCRISYRADQEINQLERYWSRITSIPLKNFYKTIPDPRTVGKPTKDRNYKGVCVIMGGRTTFQLELDMIPRIMLKRLETGPIA